MATGVMKEIFAAERNKLDAKAVSKYNGEELTENPQLNVSESEDDALSGEGSASVTVTALKNRTTITVPNIESEDDILYFSYINGNKIYIASATAGDLIAGTAALEFEEREIVVSITDLALSGSQYYGENRDVTLTFNVTKTGTYTITQTEGSQTKTYTHVANSIGEQTITLKTLTWGTQLEVAVSTTVAGVTYLEEVDGATRNVMKFGKVDVKRSSSNISDDEVIYITLRNSNNIIGSPKASELRNGGFELPINNINSNTELKLYYNDGSERRVYEDAETLIKGDITLTLSSRN